MSNLILLSKLVLKGLHPWCRVSSHDRTNLSTFSRYALVLATGVSSFCTCATTVTTSEGTSSTNSVTRQEEDEVQQPARLQKKESKGVISKDEDYIQGIKIYGIGILEDPVPGEKRGRGVQHLTSSYFIYDMGIFIDREFTAMQAMVKYAYERSKIYPGYDYRYFTNVSNALFLKAEADGLMTADGRDFFLMAAWCAMVAAEVDGFQYAKYSPEQRAKQRDAFYNKYLNPKTVWINEENDDLDLEKLLGKYAIEGCRIDMIPSVALERYQ